MKRVAYRPWFWEDAPFFRVLPPLILAICCYERNWYQGGGQGLPYIAVAVFLVVFGYSCIVRSLRSVVGLLRFILLQCLIFWMGIACCRVSDVTTRPAWFGHHIDSTATYRAQIVREPEEKARTWKLTVRVTGMLRDTFQCKLTGTAFVYLYKNDSVPGLHTGDEILLPGGWQPIESSSDPFAFDYRRYAARNGLYYQQFRTPEELFLYRRAAPMDAGLIAYVHNWCMRQLAYYLPDRATLGILQAMLIGDEVNLDPELRQAYSETGIIHVVAISGGHVMMLFMIISATLFWIRHQRHRWIKYVVALPIVWFYVLISGAPPSAVRSVIMFSVLALGVSLGKGHNARNQLFATAFILLCFEPMWLFSVGFQLSFIAVLSLILFYRPVYQLWPQTTKVGRALWEAAAASIAAELLVAPLVIYYFHLFPLSFVLANVIAWLLMGLVLVAGILLIVVSWLPPLAGIIAVAITFAVTWFNKVIYVLQIWNPEPLRHLVLTPISLLVLYILISCGAGALINKSRLAVWGALGSLCLFMWLLCIEEWHTLRQHRLVAFYNRGQTLLERVAGKYHYLPDSVSSENHRFTLGAANTGWRAWRQGTAVATSETFQVNGKTVLLLREPIRILGDATFPVHTLIVDQPLQQLSFTDMQRIFSPVQLVICGRQYRNAVQGWRNDGAVHGIAVHVLQGDGAFVMK